MVVNVNVVVVVVVVVRSGRGHGICLHHQTPKYTLGDEDDRNYNSRWKTLAVRLPAKLRASRESGGRETSRCKQAEMVETDRVRHGGDTIHGVLKELHQHSGWPV